MSAVMADSSRIRSALSCIQPNDRELWVKMAMAIKSELSDDEGFSIWSEWSQCDDSFNERDAVSVWRGINPSGNVNLGTLFYEAKKNGWADTGQTFTLSPQEIAKQKADREAARLVQQAQDQAKYKQAATRAEELYAAAAPADETHPYLLKKGIRANSLFRVYRGDLKISDMPMDGALLVPIGDEKGLSGLEFILEDGTKRPLPSGEYKAKYFHHGAEPTDILNICEGISTGSSIFEATGTPTFSARGCSNLKNVAIALKQRYPHCTIRVCGDLGNGEKNARDAAQAVDGLLALPDEESGNDFNDTHQIRGLGAVKQAIESVVQAGDDEAKLDQTPWELVDEPKAVGTSVGAIAAANKAKKAARKAAQLASDLPYGFTISNEGVFYTSEGTDDKPATPLKICSPLRVTAKSRGKSSEDWGRVVSFKDADDMAHDWAIPMEMLAGDGSEMRRELARLGLEMASGLAAKNRLNEYIIQSKPAARARCVQQTGWYKDSYVMPNRTIGTGDETVLYQAESKTACQYLQSGTVEEWRDNVASLCVGNSRLMLAVSASFAGMILHHGAQESGGIHFVGSSSTGKSTAQLLAASVYGGTSFKQSWRATGNALEGTCAIHNDAALILDEMAEVDPKEVGGIVYMIGNGTGKGRAGRNGDARARKTWRLMIVSSGEIGLAQHMRDGGKIAKAGQEVRMIDIAADAGAGHGIFEELHGFDGGAKLSDAIKEVTGEYYGSPAIIFLQRLTANLKDFPTSLKQAMKAFNDEHLPSDAGGQAARVCNRFAIVAVAGEMATDAGITGWQSGDSIKAAATCFQSWLDSRGGGGNQERTAILSSVRAFFESHGESRFSDVADMTNRITINRAGYRSSGVDGQEYYVLPEAYKRDVCAGYDMKAVSKILIEAGILAPDKDGKNAQRKSLPDMGSTRCYVISSKIWGE
ncbi:DUF927 domain-containing protein [soil metagenome]